MGFTVGRYAKIWSFKDEGKWGTVNLSVSRKDKETGVYKTDFKDGFVSVVGSAYEAVKGAVIDPKRGLTVRIASCDVTNTYNDAKGNTSFKPHYTLFGIEIPDDNNGSAPVQTKKESKPDKVDDFVNIADGIGDEELPFN